MSVWLHIGRDSIRLDLLDRWGRPPVVAPRAGTLRQRVREAAGIAEAACGPSPAALETAARRDPAIAARIDRFTTARRIALTVPDATRRGPWSEYLAASLDWIASITPNAERRTLLIATGLHAPVPPDGLRLPDSWTIAVNGDGGYEGHVALGATPRGTSVRLHPAWVAADARFVLADLSFHYFAGFGGGRKLVFPGLGEPEGILANHRHCLTSEGDLHPACRSGLLKSNPVHEDLLEAVALAPPDLLIQVSTPAPGDAVEVEIGDWRDMHERGCARYLEGHLLDHTLRPSVIIADAGGSPRDSTFLQAHKSVQHAARFLPDGGRLLLAASLEEGFGSESLERLLLEDRAELTRRAVEDYRLHTHTALAMRRVSSRIQVGILSRMEAERLRPVGVVPFSMWEDALRWLEGGGAPRAWGWLARAEETLPRLIGAVPVEEEST